MRRTLSSLAIVSLLLAVGCSSTRPLHVIKSSAKDAADLGNYQQAAKEYETYLEIRREDYRARFDYGKALLKIDRPVEARREFSICTEAEPLNDEYWDYLAESIYAANDRPGLTTLLEQRCHDRGTVADYSRMGVYSAKMGNPDEAEHAFKMAAKVDQGRTSKVQKQLADFYGTIGDKANQVKRLRMALYLDPQNPQLVDEVRRMGEIPGPSFWLPPAEATPLVGYPEPSR